MSTVAFASAVMHIPTGNSRTADTIDGAAPPQTADGSLTVTVVPPVGGHSIEMSPFCASIRRLAVGRPSPVPPSLGGEEWREHPLPHIPGNSRALVGEGDLTRRVNGLDLNADTAITAHGVRAIDQEILENDLQHLGIGSGE